MSSQAPRTGGDLAASYLWQLAFYEAERLTSQAGGNPAAHRQARAWGLPDLAEAAGLLASGLVTRAVVTAGAPAPARYADLYHRPLHFVILRLRAHGPGLLIEVWDRDPTPPPPMPKTAAACSSSASSPASSAGTTTHPAAPGGGGGACGDRVVEDGVGIVDDEQGAAGRAADRLRVQALAG
jgi:hypothetical protein